MAIGLVMMVVKPYEIEGLTIANKIRNHVDARQAGLAGQPGRPTGPCFERRFDLNALFSDPIPPVVGAAEKDDKKSAVVSDIATRRGGKQMPAIAMSMGAACCRG